MPSLSSNKLYAAPAMTRALLAAGQFVHIDEMCISESLNALYEWPRRDLLDRDVRRADPKLAVPDVLVKAVNAGLMPRAFDPLHTIGFVARRYGVACCLCGGIGWSSEIYGDYFGRPDFSIYICPTYLRIDGLPEGYRKQTAPPLCQLCVDSVQWWAGNNIDHEAAVPDDKSAMWCGALAWLSKNTRFRERVRARSNSVKSWRFDPRRVPIQQRAAA